MYADPDTLKRTLADTFTDHHWYPGPGHIVTCSTQSIRQNTPREPARVYQVWLLWHSTTCNLVAQAVYHLLYWTVRHEAICLLALRDAPLAPMGWRLGSPLDRGQRGSPDRIRHVHLPRSHERPPILHYRWLHQRQGIR